MCMDPKKRYDSDKLEEVLKRLHRLLCKVLFFCLYIFFLFMQKNTFLFYIRFLFRLFFISCLLYAFIVVFYCFSPRLVLCVWVMKCNFELF